jgi:hypothetical protein
MIRFDTAINVDRFVLDTATDHSGVSCQCENVRLRAENF